MLLPNTQGGALAMLIGPFRAMLGGWFLSPQGALPWAVIIGPFRALLGGWFPSPGRCPGAILIGPFRALLGSRFYVSAYR